jgi:hypothetical protein
VGVIVAGFKVKLTAGIIAIVLSPIVFLLYITVFRIWLEILVVVFRIADHVRDIAKKEPKPASQPLQP